MDIDQLVEWLDDRADDEELIWLVWFSKKYCDNCERGVVYDEYYGRERGCVYCETHNNCCFFPDMQKVPDHKEIIKLWLESEVQDGGIL